MTKVYRVMLATLFVLAVNGAAVAGPYEDGLAAYKGGDYATALRLWRPLALLGDGEAQSNLGVIYGNGEGVVQNYGESAKWYRLAAEQGHAKAQSYFGLMCADGQGVSQNYVTAHMWFSLAASRGDASGTKGRDRAAGEMTPQQIAEAQKLAAEWKPKTWDELKRQMPR